MKSIMTNEKIFALQTMRKLYKEDKDFFNKCINSITANKELQTEITKDNWEAYYINNICVEVMEELDGKDVPTGRLEFAIEPYYVLSFLRNVIELYQK